MFRIARCHEAESKARVEEGSSVPIFVIIATKFTKLSQNVCCNKRSLESLRHLSFSWMSKFVELIFVSYQSRFSISFARRKSKKSNEL